MMLATTRKKALIAVFLRIAGRIPSVDDMVDVLKRLPIDAKHRAKRRVLLRELAAIDRQLSSSRRQIPGLPMRSTDWRYRKAETSSKIDSRSVDRSM
jgi:hypothetical protein